MRKINKCCVCEDNVKTIFELPFRYTDNIYNETYVQNIGICEKCGLIFTQNPFTEKQLEDRYKKFSKFEFDDKDYILNDSEDYKKRCLRQKFFIESNVDTKIESIIEIGASSGYNLSLYNKTKCIGIEPSEKNCILAKKNYNIEMYNGMFSDYIDSKKSEKFDLVFVSHTLEHIVNPFEFIINCKKICNDYIFIEVPTIDYKFINEPFGLFCEEHVNYFSLENLTNLMTKAGFEIVNAQILIEPYSKLPAGFPSLAALFKKSNGLTKKSNSMLTSYELLDNYININKREMKRIKNYISDIPAEERLAIWGTGHHVSMLLENTDLKNKNIVKFYDSDIKKENLTIMGKTISPFDEKDIIGTKIDGILIGTYTAQDAIYKILKKYEGKCKIYKMYNL